MKDLSTFFNIQTMDLLFYFVTLLLFWASNALDLDGAKERTCIEISETATVDTDFVSLFVSALFIDFYFETIKYFCSSNLFFFTC